MWNQDGTVVRAFASTNVAQFLGLGVISGLSLWLVLFLALMVVSPVPSVFAPFSNYNISKFQFDLESEGHRFAS